MKRWVIYGLVIALLLVLRPQEMKDVGQLLPVELLYIYKEGGYIRVETDDGTWGRGLTLQRAFDDLKETAPGSVFLETADYLMVTHTTAALLPELAERLRPATEVCIGWRIEEQTLPFLQAHKPGVSLKDIRAGKKEIPVLIQKGGRCNYGEPRNYAEKT